MHDLIAHEKTLHAFTQEHVELSATEQQHAAEIANLEKTVRDIRVQLKAIDDALDSSQEQLVEASSEVERWEGRKALMNEKRSNAEKQLQQSRLNLHDAKLVVKELQLNEVEKKAQFSEKQKEVQQIRQTIKQLEQALTRTASEIEEEIEQSKNKYINLLK